jgi:hypothetical protein
VTIAVPPGDGIGELSEFAAGRDITFAHIVLDRGSTRSQPMLTMPGRGTLTAQVGAAGSLSRDLAGAGFTVARVKVEAAPWNGDVPAVTDAEQAAYWQQARRTAIITVLTAISESPWAEHLVLRGSVLLKAWFGTVAREPGDLDFVVIPARWSSDADRSRQMLTGIAARAQHASAGSPASIDAGRAAIEGIWTYDRVPGLRMMLPWTADDGHSG